MKKLNNTQRLILTIAIYLSFIGGMASQINHTVIIYLRLEPDNLIIAYCMAVSFDLFVAISISIGWIKPAIIASLAMLSINLLFYGLLEMTIPGISAILISIIQPCMIWAYSTLIHEQNKPDEEEQPKIGRPKGSINKPKEKDIVDLFSKNQIS